MRFKENISPRAYSAHPMDEEELRAAQLLLPALGSALAVPLQGRNESFPVSLKKWAFLYTLMVLRQLGVFTHFFTPGSQWHWEKKSEEAFPL